MHRIFPIGLLLLISYSATLTGCATVPKEVVELSYVVGQDIESIHESYRSLVRRYFDNLREERIVFFNEQFVPLFLKNYLQETEFQVQVANSDSQAVYQFLQVWIEVGMDAIQERQKDLIDPLNLAEDSLLQSVDAAFEQLLRANAAISSHLNSIRKVQDMNIEVMKTLGLADLREKIDASLVAASKRADETLEKMKQAEEIIK